jgi:hypothetical protein
MLTAVLAGATLYHSVRAAATDERRKLTPEEAGYKISTDGALTCAACAYFVAPRYCGIMEGEVSPEGTCKYFRDVE